MNTYAKISFYEKNYNNAYSVIKIFICLFFVHALNPFQIRLCNSHKYYQKNNQYKVALYVSNCVLIEILFSNASSATNI